MLGQLDTETKLNLADRCVEIVGELVKDRMVRKRRMDMLEARKNAQVDIARARQESLSSPSPTPDDGAKQPSGSDAPAPVLDRRIERAIETEDCEFCVAIYRQLLDEDEETKVRGLEEMSTLKGFMDSGDVDQSDLDELMQQFEVVPRLSQRV